MIKPKVVLLIFVSGKIVLTGAKVMLLSVFLNNAMSLSLTLFNYSVTLLTITYRSLGERGDLYRFQHHLHCALRIP